MAAVPVLRMVIGSEELNEVEEPDTLPAASKPKFSEDEPGAV